jgi:hypothetical protein
MTLRVHTPGANLRDCDPPSSSRPSRPSAIETLCPGDYGSWLAGACGSLRSMILRVSSAEVHELLADLADLDDGRAQRIVDLGAGLSEARSARRGRDGRA